MQSVDRSFICFFVVAQFGTNPPPTFDHPLDFEEEYVSFRQEEDVSIGIVLESDSVCAHIKRIQAEGPAADVPGLRAGMRIKMINGESVEGWPFSLVTQRIQNAGRPIEIMFATVPSKHDSAAGGGGAESGGAVPTAAPSRMITNPALS